jgi:L-alanine-DL-glutamate epimerase-like enolase superfamily enzyme
VTADLCVGHLPVAMKAISEGIVSSICIKPPFLGGLTIGRHVMDACVNSGMQMRIDGPFCGDIASAANLHLAVCAQPELLIAGCDLREPQAINTDLQGVAQVGSNRIAPSCGLGLGITVSEGRFGTPDAVYHSSD